MSNKIEIPVSYNGVTKLIPAEPHQEVQALLQHTIQAFGVNQNAHLLSLFREDLTKVDEKQSVADAHLTSSTHLLLRQDTVKGGEA